MKYDRSKGRLIGRTLFLLCALLALLVSCAAPAQPQIASKEMNLFAFSAYVPQEILTGFEKETGVKVNLQTYANNEQLVAGLVATPGKYDVIIPSDYTVERLIKQNKLRPLDLAQIQNYNNIIQGFRTPYFDPGGATSVRRGASDQNEKFSLPYLWGTTGILYDPGKVSTPITGWRDLWRPELKAHLVVLDDPRELMGAALLTLGFSKNTTNPGQLGQARDKLKELTPGVVAYDSAEPEKKILSGEAWVAVVFSGNAALAIRQNPGLVYVLPEEGAGIWFDNMAIPADSTHVDAAQAFINYVLRPEVAAVIIRDFPYSTPNQALLDYLKKSQPDFYNAYITSIASSPSQDVLAGAQLVKDVGDTSALFEQYWQEAKGK